MSSHVRARIGRITALFLALYIHAAPLPAEVAGKYYISPDRYHVLLVFPEKNQSYYFNNNADRLCYTFRIPGQWLPGRQPDLLRLKDSRDEAGVLLIPKEDLQQYEGEELVERAIKFITGVHSGAFEQEPAESRVTPHESGRWPGMKKWTAMWVVKRDGGLYRLSAEKLFVEVRPGWVAQLTVPDYSDEGGVLDAMLDTLAFTDDPECFWPFINRHIPAPPGK